MPIDNEDFVVMWHLPGRAAPVATDDEEGTFEVPGLRLHEQSVNSLSLNETGFVEDVKINVATGEVVHEREVACFKVGKIRMESFITTKVKEPRPRTSVAEFEVTPNYHYDVQHKPEACVYPHCELILYANGMPVESTPDLPAKIKTAIRAYFGRIAAEGANYLAKKAKTAAYKQAMGRGDANGSQA